MESMDFWRLCEEVSIKQAALLIAGEDPSGGNNYVENWEFQNQPVGYQAAKTALSNATSAGDLPATVRRNLAKAHLEDSETEKWLGQKGEYKNDIDIDLTTIKVKDLKIWLARRGFTTGFFFPADSSQKAEYLDNQNPNYSPKLAAAIEAWQAITSQPELVKAKSVKQAIVIWLRTNAGKYGLIKDDGNPNESGIEEVAKVVNWETKGGAPKTP